MSSCMYVCMYAWSLWDRGSLKTSQGYDQSDQSEVNGEGFVSCPLLVKLSDKICKMYPHICM